ncbi:hypothetical protein BUALT_Bualt03G0190400 [Buddleja alternifolia]|uniref:OPA3-like protein n=1 Tax=Buddleja alternifolia TaxID=168488 RepID=A0AAV6Y6C4_9LAMI|nr:hypothetical protein BUALT_Bualt03G0190400 [Buddleja alternifolia]
MILPVFKLGTLALKTLCKPIGNRIKKQAGLHPNHPVFRSIPISRNLSSSISVVDQLVKAEVEHNLRLANHRLTTNLQRRIYGHATDVVIRPLNEEKAVQAAADLLGELFVFTVAGTAVIFEVQRSSRSEARKEELHKRELEEMKQRDEEVAREVEQLKHRIAELEEQLTKERGLTGAFRFKESKGTDHKTTVAKSS